MTNKTPLTVEYFEKLGFEHDTTLEEYRGEVNGEPYYYLYSPDSRITVDNWTNLPYTEGYPDWEFHVDNEDMDSLANFDVNNLEDANTILGVYKLKI